MWLNNASLTVGSVVAVLLIGLGFGAVSVPMGNVVRYVSSLSLGYVVLKPRLRAENWIPLAVDGLICTLGVLAVRGDVIDWRILVPALLMGVATGTWILVVLRRHVAGGRESRVISDEDAADGRLGA